MTDFDAYDFEPGPPIEGSEVLHEVRNAIRRYVAMPSDEALTAVTLWIVATHAVEFFEHATRLCVHSPVKRCGKSRLLEVIAALAHAPMPTTNISVPALFRVIDKAGDHPPTLILDEADRLFGSRKADDENRDLIAMLNNGFRRGAPTWRCVGPKQEPTPFKNFAFVAVAGIGRLPDTVEDRGVNITMRRRLPGEAVEKYRMRTDEPALHAARERVAEWVADNTAAIETATRTGFMVPVELEDRAQDAWEPLIACAVAAGGTWPTLARDAAIALTREASQDDADQSLDVALLRDVREVFPEDASFLSTARLLSALRALGESPWSDLDLTARRLAMRLGKFGVKPGRDTTGTERGYHRRDLTDAFSRYLPSVASEPSDDLREQGGRTDALTSSDASNRQTRENRQGVTAGQMPI